MKSILVIEDDHDLLNLYKTHFKNEVGVHFHYATTYLEALALVAQRGFDLYIVDLNLAGYSGLEILQILQKEKKIDNRVIITSADLTEETEIKGYNLGASNFLKKPLNFEVLKSIMNKNLRALDNHFEERIDFETFWISPANYACYRRTKSSEKELSLTLTEFNILLKLSRAANTVVSKDDLSYLGRDRSRPMSYKSLEMHIAALRRKLQTKGIIQNKRGIGYILTPPKLSLTIE